MRCSFSLFVFLLSLFTSAQSYPPAAGQPGSTAMFKDSSAFISWANTCRITRGYQDISNPTLGWASVGDSTMALGKAQVNGVVSLGDGGWAICGFQYPIQNGPGADFAVFENGFGDYFLELATVEVSSDGINFFPFPSHSLTDTLVQKGSFDSLKPIHLNNLAGKYRSGFGTPFDLAELQGISGLDLNAIGFVKIRDVVGCIQNTYASRDTQGNKINDPWPTPFASGGFDLDAVGVIHQNMSGLAEGETREKYCSCPVLLRNEGKLLLQNGRNILKAELMDNMARCVTLEPCEAGFQLPRLSPGLYYLRLFENFRHHCCKVLIEE